MLTELWRIVEVILAGPAGMLALQSLLLLEGSYHLLRRAMGARGAALGACGVLLFPPILATMAVVCPEAQLAGWLAAGAAALGSERRGVRFAGLGLLVVATGMQGGAALATLPIVVLGWPWQQGRAAWQRAAAALGAWAILTAGAARIDHALADEHTGRPEVALAMDDVVGTIAAAGPLGDAALQRELAGVSLAATDHLQARARAIASSPAHYAAGPARLFEPPTDDGARDALAAARRTVALDHPRAYLAHRLHRFARVLGLYGAHNWQPMITWFGPNPDPVHIAASHAPVQRALIAAVRPLSRSFVFRPFVYLALALIFVPLALVRRERVAFVALASGIAFELAQAFVRTDAAFRDSSWLLVSCAIGVIICVARFAPGEGTRPA
jgi:hypothetical protein